MEKHVGGPSFRGEYDFLSNFYNFKTHFGKTIKYKDHVVSNLEILYVALKCKNSKDTDTVLKYKDDAKAAKLLGRTLEMRDDWNDIKLDMMEKILRLKFNIPELKKMLLSTKKLEIIEWNTWGDTFWGRNVETRKGSNHLGKLIMKIRDELKPKNGLAMFLTQKKK